MRGPGVLLMIAVVALAGPAPAQELPDPEANIVEEVVVTARLPGPAWWRVSDADTTVYIMSGPEGLLPADVTWDRSVFERRLESAHTFITGASLTIGLSGLPSILRARAKLTSETPLEETLPPDLRTRFAAARTRLGKPAKRYAGLGPLLAGQRLVSDSKGSGKWRSLLPEFEKAAKRRKLKPRTTAQLDGTPFLRAAMASLTMETQQKCLEWALDDVQASGRARRSAEGWARGDVQAALDHPRSFNRCLLLLGGGEAMWRRQTANQANDVAAALQRPGHAVAVIGLRRLVADDGVLEQLRRRGYQVRGPGEAG